jgi:hypothetical protein
LSGSAEGIRCAKRNHHSGITRKGANKAPNAGKTFTKQLTQACRLIGLP